MRFLIAFVALLGYASASAILAPLAYGANAGDVQAAIIDANVAAQDTARAIGEGQARAAEAAIQYNAEAVRQVAETNRNINQNLVNARAGYLGAPLAYAGAPLAYAGAPLGVAAAYGAYPYGIRAW
ncbi:cuticle protein 1-like [Maniola hyperantus]|uniref:cuticle protein 1-like n=1 Tax=Aphantopus hyperantus TaxID=2795564 RepID=UPI0015696DDB|nr:cuticle protein 1-like [Maniola hyperantus]